MFQTSVKSALILGPCNGVQGLEPRLLELRTKWGIVQPEYGRFPRWLKKRVNAAIRAGKIRKHAHGLSGGWHALEHAANEFGHNWIDHQGCLTLKDGVQVLVSEPYQMTLEAMSQLERFCYALGLHWQIRGESWWYPNSTIRIVVSEVPLG